MTGFRLTQRDLDAFKVIHGFGYMAVTQLATFWGIAYPTVSARIRKLKTQGYIENMVVLHGAGGIVKLSPLGVKAIDDDLSYLSNIRLGSYKHDLAVIDVAIQLGVVDVLTPERRIRRELVSGGVHKTAKGYHVPDFEYPDPDNNEKKIAVEVELSQKKRTRIVEIIRFYLGASQYSKVCYFCADGVVGLIEEMTEKYRQIFSVERFDHE